MCLNVKMQTYTPTQYTTFHSIPFSFLAFFPFFFFSFIFRLFFFLSFFLHIFLRSFCLPLLCQCISFFSICICPLCLPLIHIYIYIYIYIYIISHNYLIYPSMSRKKSFLAWQALRIKPILSVCKSSHFLTRWRFSLNWRTLISTDVARINFLCSNYWFHIVNWKCFANNLI